MGSKKNIIAMIVACLVVTGGIMGYSWNNIRNSADVFQNAGYILISDEDTEEKQVIFQEGTTFKPAISDTITFKDVQGNKMKVDEESFVHYEDQSMIALSAGVVVDLNDIDTAQMTNHYAIAPSVFFQWDGSAYSLSNTASELKFYDFIWKLSPTKYLIASRDIAVHFGEQDNREAGNFIEVEYIDNGVIQIQTEDNLWQTVSEDCYVSLNNGRTVNLSYKNITNSNGEVLMDFAKIIVDANSNVEVIPLTEEEANVSESVIPHFEVSSQDGRNGTDGDDGEDGDDGRNGKKGKAGNAGTVGEDGEPGEAGLNGSAGASGTDGNDGKDGVKGGTGDDGFSNKIEGTLLDYPIFTIEDWTLTPTSASGKIAVVIPDKDNMLDFAIQDNPEGLLATYYLIDLETSEIIAAESLSEGETFSPDVMKDFEFTGLEPDHSYRFVVDAPTKTTTKSDSVTYLRNYISKTFWTDSTGIFIETKGATTTSLTISAIVNDYAPEQLKGVNVYLYTSKTSATMGKTSDAIAKSNGEIKLVDSGDDKKRTVDSFLFSDLSSDTAYYVGVEGVCKDDSTLKITQVLEVSTLKNIATIGSPTATPNKDSWGFDITPGVMNDPDGGIRQIYYEFYNEGLVDTTDGKAPVIMKDAKPAKTVTVSTLNAVTIPLDNQVLKSGVGYHVRAVVEFYDNEKTVQLFSGVSNRVELIGGKLPTVYFVNNQPNIQDPTAAADVSSHYDGLYGSILVAPSVDSAQMIIDETHHPVVTIRAAGYYYTQYPVYLDTSSNKPSDKKYLTATRLSGNFWEISLPELDITAASDPYSTQTFATTTGTAGVYGLRPDTQYQVIVTGDLSLDGVNAYESNTRIGTCVVETPKMIVAEAKFESALDSGEKKMLLTTKLISANLDELDADEQKQQQDAFQEQLKNLTSITFTLLEGKAETAQKQIGSSVTLTPNTYEEILLKSAENNKQLEKQLDDAESLADLLGNQGMTIDEAFFDLKSENFSGLNSVTVRIDQAYDYTINQKNCVNQMEYASIGSNDTSAPEYSDNDGDLYHNQFEIQNNASTYYLKATPDAIPDPGDGFTNVEGVDTDGDKSYDEYELSAKYANTGNLATSITFYAFDEPDWTAKYGVTTGWEVVNDTLPSGAANSKDIPFSPVTVQKSDGSRPYLGSVTLEVKNGLIPEVKFIPQTIENYYWGLGASDEDIEAAKTAYNDGHNSTLMDSEKKKYLFFYDDAHADEPETGHQFRFAWVLEFKYSEGDETKLYPFHIDESKKAPHSPVLDVPKLQPKILAIPYSNEIADKTGESSVTWAVYVSDPEETIIPIQDGANQGKVQLYAKESTTSGKICENAIVDIHSDLKALKDYSTLIQDKNLVTIEYNVYKAITNKIGIRVQLYTDKYTSNNDNLFAAGNQYDENVTAVWTNTGDYEGKYKNGKAKVIQNHTWKTQDATNIPYYYDAFQYYRPETGVEYSVDDTVTVDNLEINITDKTDKESKNVIGYSVVVEDNNSYSDNDTAGILDRINGIRFEFYENDTLRASIDKIISTDKTTTYADNRRKLGFELSLRKELSEIAGLKNITVKAHLLCEDGHEGYSYIGGDVSVRTYSNTAQGLTKYGRFTFLENGSQLNKKDADKEKFSRMGTVMRMSTPTLSADKSTINIEFKSTRNSSLLKLSGAVQSLSIVSATGATSDAYLANVTPRKIVKTTIPASKVFVNGETTENGFDVPKLTPLITYTAATNGINHGSIEYTLPSNYTKVYGDSVYFTLESKLKSESDTDYKYLVKKGTNSNGIAQWQEVSAQDFVPSKTNTIQVKSNLKIVSFNGLQPDRDFRVVAYYYDSADTNRPLKPLFMYDSMMDEAINFKTFETLEEPVIETFRISYAMNNYGNKRLSTTVELSGLNDCYYTLELQDKNHNFLTYLDTSGSASQYLNYLPGSNNLRNTATNYYDFGMSQTSANTAHGFVYQSSGYVYDAVKKQADLAYDTDKNGQQIRIPLNYGDTYYVRLRAYSIGEGPAYDPDYKTPMDGSQSVSNLFTKEESFNSKTIKSFTVKKVTDAVYVAGSYNLIDGESAIVFAPTFAPGSYITRGERYAIMIVRERQLEDGTVEVTDITSAARNYATNYKIGSEASGYWIHINSGKVRIAVMNNDVEGEILKNDKITCYIYGILDDMETQSCLGVSGYPLKDYGEFYQMVLQGRGVLEGQEALSTSKINLVDGTGSSNLMASSSVIAKSSSVSAGQVGISANNTSYEITFTEPIKPDALKYAKWQMVISHYYEEGGITVFGSEQLNSGGGGQAELVELQCKPTGTNGYSAQLNFTLPPSVKDPIMYTLTLSFYEDAEGTKPIEIESLVGSDGTLSADGYKITHRYIVGGI